MRNLIQVLALILLTVALGFGVAVWPATPNKEFIVHEWGTFTTVQDPSGQVQEWRSPNDWDLPKFVYTIQNLSKGKGLRQVKEKCCEDKLIKCDGCNTCPKDQGCSCKKCGYSHVRMETPVVYFYSDKEQEVSLKVDFPKGKITEWYPQANIVGPGIDWGKFKLLIDTKTGSCPIENGYKGHYTAARDTDANLVRVCGLGNETEKFLFYRGVGNFETPLVIKMESDDKLELRNNGTIDISDIFVLCVSGGKLAFTQHSKLSAKKSVAVNVPAGCCVGEKGLSELCKKIIESLVNQGLFEKEAKAFVETWKESYVNTDGVRILYMLPQKFTDEILPLSIDPKPDKIVRAMIARIECITPSIKSNLVKLVQQLGEDDPQRREEAKKILLKLGRFAEAALKVALKETKDAEIKSAAEQILFEISKIQSGIDVR